MLGSSTCSYHYWSHLLCQVPKTLGEGWKKLGNAFAENSSRQKTFSVHPSNKQNFVEYRLSGTRHTYCRDPNGYSQQNKVITRPWVEDGAVRSLPSSLSKHLPICRVSNLGLPTTNSSPDPTMCHLLPRAAAKPQSYRTHVGITTARLYSELRPHRHCGTFNALSL